MAGSRGTYRYTSDTGTNYALDMDASNASAMGFAVADPADLPLPKRMRPRAVHALWFSAGGPGQAVGAFRRTLPVPNLTSPYWTGANRTVSLPDFDSVPGAGQTTPNVMRPFGITGYRGERRTVGKLAGT